MVKRPVVVVLAAGQSTRMKSRLSKVLHPVGGLPVLGHILTTALSLEPQKIIVVHGPEGAEVAEFAKNYSDKIVCCEQVDRLGTAHAALMAEKEIGDSDAPILVMLGDAPLVEATQLKESLQKITEGAGMCVIGFEAHNPHGYGRMVMDGERLVSIVEEKDTNDDNKKITFCNSGVMAFDGAHFIKILKQIGNDNAQKEYYLPDAVIECQKNGLDVVTTSAAEEAFLGINDRTQLAAAEAIFQKRKRLEIMQQGVTIVAPDTVFFAYDTCIGQDSYIEPHVVFGTGVKIGENVKILAHSHIEQASIGDKSNIGPFARLRPGTELGAGVKVGNFVETKKAQVHAGAKINHLSYIGDAEVGEKANIGAGTITCNYDGFNKHKTLIGKEAFIGSNSSLVAPVEIEEGAYVGSGSVITKKVPKNALAFTRASFRVVEGWAERFRKKFSK